MPDFVMHDLLFIINYSLPSFRSQTFHSVCYRCFYCLEANGDQCNKNGDATSKSIHPPMKTDPVCKTLQPFIHSIIPQRNGDNCCQQYRLSKSLDNNSTIFCTEEPNTFRTPTSFVRLMAV